MTMLQNKKAVHGRIGLALLAALAVISFSVSSYFVQRQALGDVKQSLNPPSIKCFAEGDYTITLEICGGVYTGAPGGFSIQWITWEQFVNGPDGIPGNADDKTWPSSDDPNLCKASFSGQAHNTNWNLGAGDCRYIDVGNLDSYIDTLKEDPGYGPSGGVSTNCGGKRSRPDVASGSRVQ